MSYGRIAIPDEIAYRAVIVFETGPNKHRVSRSRPYASTGPANAWLTKELVWAARSHRAKSERAVDYYLEEVVPGKRIDITDKQNKKIEARIEAVLKRGY